LNGPHVAMASTSAGYSGTPLVRKLGIRPGMTVQVIDAPLPYERFVEHLPPDLQFVARTTATTQFVHLFCTDAARLERALTTLRARLLADAVVWVSWPKKSSGVAGDVDENVVRRIALPMGYVDVKVCAVDATWSGLKLVVRKALR
jgi:hypothetical protein